MLANTLNYSKLRNLHYGAFKVNSILEMDAFIKLILNLYVHFLSPEALSRVVQKTHETKSLSPLSFGSFCVTKTTQKTFHPGLRNFTQKVSWK